MQHTPPTLALLCLIVCMFVVCTPGATNRYSGSCGETRSCGVLDPKVILSWRPLG